MNDPRNSKIIGEQLLAYEAWCEFSWDGSKDIETFIAEKNLPEDVADGLRNVADAELAFANLMTKDKGEVDSDLPFYESEVVEGKTIGKYRCIRRLGAGGMGEVWLAQQGEPVKRKVAIKLIRPGLYSASFARRFQYEQQAMAMMSHPNVANVLDSGTTENHSPYFVMEYIPGVPITDFCSKHPLSLEQRLELFLQLCDAVQHAHQKGLLHRDIKPSNILVAENEGKLCVKVIDFGLAKLFNEEQQNPALTAPKTILGSPQWMSPEQAGGALSKQADIDTRSDIYSIGIILYQLLTNSTPITDAKYSKAKPVELIASICDEVPPYPSVRFESQGKKESWVESQTTSSRSSWVSMLRNDLDWVTMKAIDKDRNRRYGSVGELADDVRRFLEDEPVLARPPSLIYQLKKLYSKHRIASLSTVLALASLVVATGVSLWFANRAFKLETIAVEQRAIAVKQEALAKEQGAVAIEQAAIAKQETFYTKQMVEFLVRGFEKNDISMPGVEFSKSKRALLISWQEDLDQNKLSMAPKAEAWLRSALARSFAGSGENQKAIQELKKVIKINTTEFGPNHDSVLDSKITMVMELLEIKKYNEAELLAIECVSDSRNKGKEDELRIGAELCLLKSRIKQGEVDATVKELRDLVSRSKLALGSQHQFSIEGMTVLAELLLTKDMYQDSNKVASEAREIASEKWGEYNLRTVELDFLAWTSAALSDGAKTSTPETLSGFSDKVAKKYGSESVLTMKFRNRHGDALFNLGKLIAASKVFEENIEDCKKHLGETHAETANALRGWAISRHLFNFPKRLRTPKEVIEASNSAFEIFKTELGIGSFEALDAAYFCSKVQIDTGQFKEASIILDETIPIAVETFGRSSFLAIRLTRNKAKLSVQGGQEVAKGIAIYKKNIELTVDRHGEDSIDAANAMMEMGMACSYDLQFESAIPNFRQALKTYRQQKVHEGVTLENSLWFINALLNQKQYEEAKDEAKELLRVSDPQTDGNYITSGQLCLAQALIGQAKFDESSEPLATFDSQEADTKPPASLQRADMLRVLHLIHEGKLEDAKTLIVETNKVLKPMEKTLFPTHRWYVQMGTELELEVDNELANSKK